MDTSSHKPTTRQAREPARKGLELTPISQLTQSLWQGIETAEARSAQRGRRSVPLHCNLSRSSCAARVFSRRSAGQRHLIPMKLMPLPLMPLPNLVSFGWAVAWWARAWISSPHFAFFALFCGHSFGCACAALCSSRLCGFAGADSWMRLRCAVFSRGSTFLLWSKPDFA